VLALISITDWIILALLAILVLLVWATRLALARVEARLGRLESRLQSAPSQSTASDSDEGSGSAYEQFLAEDPQRLAMPKSEQFAAYRQWRREKGMNWSNS